MSSAGNPEDFRMFGVILRGSEIVDPLAAQDAQRRIHCSYLVAAVAAVVALLACIFGDDLHRSSWSWLLVALYVFGASYGAWASFWGIWKLWEDLAIDRWEGLRDDESRLVRYSWKVAEFTPIGHALGGAVLVTGLAALALGALYGIAGGAVPQFQRQLRIAKAGLADPKPPRALSAGPPPFYR